MRPWFAPQSLFICMNVCVLLLLSATANIAHAESKHLAFVPQHEQVSYLRVSPTNPDKFDLWVYDIASQQERIILQDIATDYHWSPDGTRLLVNMNERLFLLNMQAETPLLEALTASDESASQAQFSPRGTYVSFIVDQRLQRIHVNTRERQSYPLPVQRYWWSPDEAYLAVTHTQADTLSQQLALHLVQANTGTITAVPEPPATENRSGYLRALNWLPDGERFTYEWLDRNQQSLDLWLLDYQPQAKANAEASAFNRTLLLTETSPTWVNSEHNLHLLSDGKHFIWTSARSGYNHIYLYRLDGKLIRQISSGNWDVEQVHGADNTTGVVYFSAREKSPLELHLYRASLSTGNPSQPTRISAPDGEHKIAFDARLRNYIDYFSSPSKPPQISLHGPTGQRIQWLQQASAPATAPQSEFGQVQAANGVDLHYRLIKPADFVSQQRYPVIVRLHGGPESQQVTQSWHDAMDQYFVAQGYLVFHLDNRGTAGRGYDFAHSIYQNLGTLELNDQRQGVQFLQQLDYVAADSILLLSDPAQGYLTLASWLQDDAPYAAVVSFNPVVDWLQQPQIQRERYLGRSPEQPRATAPENDSAIDVYRRANLTTRLAALDPEQLQQRVPLLLVYTERQDRIASQQQTLLQQLQSRGVQFQHMWYPHAHTNNASDDAPLRQHQLELITEFFKRAGH